MATEQLIVELDARTAKLDAKLRRTESRLDELDGTVKKTDGSLKSFSKTASRAGAAIVALGAIVGAGAFVRYADQIQLAENQLKSVTASTEEFNAVQDELRRIAGETRQSLSELTSVYARFKRAGEEAGFTIQETLDLTESLTKAFKIEGNTTAEVNSVLLQLTQSFRSGVIAGEEFRSLSEGSTLVLRALSKQLGVATGDLKEMAAQGLVTPEALIAGLKGADKEINEQFVELEPTFAEVGTAMGRVFTAAFDDSVAESTSSKLKATLIDIASDIEHFLTGDETLTESGLEKRINEMAVKVLAMKEEFNELSEEERGFSFLADRIRIATAELDAYQNRLNELQASDPVELLAVGGVEDPRIQQERDFALAVLEIRAEQQGTLEDEFQHEVEVHKLALDAKLINEREYQKAVNDSAKNFVKAKKVEAATDKAATATKLDQQRRGIAAGMALNSALFDDNKAIAAGLIVADTATAIMKSLSINPYDYVNVGILAATGAAQLANALSASKGGGASSGASGGGGSPQQQESFTPETSDIGLDFRTDDASSVQVIRFDTETGDQLIDALSGMLNENMRQGRG